MVYPVYILFIVLSTAGIPIAISKIVAERMAQGNHKGAVWVLKISVVFLVIASLFFSVLLFFMLPYLTGKVLSNPKTSLCLLALIPSIVIVSVSSALRGFFQGLQDMQPTAIAQIVEQITRIFISLYLAIKMLPRGVEYATAGLAIGVVIGEVAGLLIISAMYYYKVHTQKHIYRRGTGENPSGLFKEMFYLSAPITMDRVVSTILFSIDAIIIPHRLELAGFSVKQATEVYSQLQGIAMPLLFFPTTVTIALATTIIPAISDAQAQRNHFLVQNRITDVMKITFIVGLPSLAIFYLFPHQIT
jgi:stage V sporulation protein B